MEIPRDYKSVEGDVIMSLEMLLESKEVNEIIEKAAKEVQEYIYDLLVSVISEVHASKDV